MTIAEKSVEIYIEWCSRNTNRMNVASRYQHRIFQVTPLQTQMQTQACGSGGGGGGGRGGGGSGGGGDG